MRPLEEIRKDIDAIDQQIRDLLMKRLDCSEQVVASKIEAKNYVIYRADRENMMLENLAHGVPEKRTFLPFCKYSFISIKLCPKSLCKYLDDRYTPIFSIESVDVCRNL